MCYCLNEENFVKHGFNVDYKTIARNEETGEEVGSDETSNDSSDLGF